MTHRAFLFPLAMLAFAPQPVSSQSDSTIRVKPRAYFAAAPAKGVVVGVIDKDGRRLRSGPHDFTIAEQGKQLTAPLAGQDAGPMRLLGNGTFGMGFDAKLRITFTVENGRATKLMLLQNGATFLGSRK